MPLYMGLARRLSEGLQRGKWQLEGALPSERVLAEVLDVSRETARKALGLLCQRGLLVRVQGSGTYRAEAGAVKGHQGRAVGSAGHGTESPNMRLLSRDLAPASPSEQHILGLVPGQSVWRLLTLQIRAGESGVAQVLTQYCLPLRSYTERIDATDLWRHQLDEHFQAHDFGETYRLQHLEAVAASLLQAKQLGIAAGTALLKLQQWRCAPSGQVLAIETCWRCGADAGLCVELSVAGAGPRV